MELFLQFGWGMMAHSRALLKEWGGGSVVLSPRDLEGGQLLQMAKDIHKRNGKVLLDPQFYVPHSDHHRLVAHDYWPEDYDSVMFWTGSELEDLLRRLRNLNDRLRTDIFILPGLYASSVSGEWLEQQRAYLEEAERIGLDLEACYATVALSDSAVQDDQQIEDLLEGSADWPAKGVYLIAEHPRGDYLVDNPTWLANQLDLVAGWRLQGRDVLVGYSSHQNLILSAAGASGLASGTWMNVRSFPPEKFRTQYEDEIRRRTTWYYAPTALSEFKIPFLDIAARQALLDDLKPDSSMEHSYSEPLFAGAQPTASGFSEPDAFRHYLLCLANQTGAARKASFDDTLSTLEGDLDRAEDLLDRLHAVGVSGQMRDFADCIDPCRAALRLLESTRGPVLRREWNSL